MKSTAKESEMKINPYQRLISLPIQSENIFHFPEGLLGFEDIKEFIFLLQPDTRPFIFMHALNPPDLTFVCIDPFMVCPDYKPRITDADTKKLNIKDQSDALLLSIVTVQKDVRNCTTNLQGPILINIQSCVGKQILCDGQNYPVRFRIWEALDNMTGIGKQNKKVSQNQAVHAP